MYENVKVSSDAEAENDPIIPTDALESMKQREPI